MEGDDLECDTRSRQHATTLSAPRAWWAPAAHTRMRAALPYARLSRTHFLSLLVSFSPPFRVFCLFVCLAVAPPERTNSNAPMFVSPRRARGFRRRSHSHAPHSCPSSAPMLAFLAAMRQSALAVTPATRIADRTDPNDRSRISDRQGWASPAARNGGERGASRAETRGSIIISRRR